ncbi:exonuclease 1 isoform X3 [Sciurus carolinensis]|uniref:exonuclease 1 isoform X3 n=1 Tax=Sciurus carolinensis TaxID=30640 RepID=UPI001FB1FE0A|nr:exonuclease 1 isoform X3 [Sciurus carolinensis]
MGIQGLLQFIKEASEPVHVRKYKGQVVAVDTYCWLHKGAIACAEKLAKGEPTDRYVGFCMKFVNMLLSHGVTPILVFDGCTLPSKKEVERSRRERRQANLLKGKQLLREGRVSEARDCFTRSINITHVMAHKVIKAARSQGVDCLVAPYEADAQLAYLNKAGIVQAIITEDSDLLAFGCKKVILKMDQFGNGLEIDQARLGMCKQLGDIFTEEKFRYMCILSGCDYLSSLRGIGLAKACKVLRLANNPDIVKSDLSRSHSWNNKTGQKSSTVNSIWHRNYCPRLELDNVSGATQLKENPSTVGIKQVISTKGLNLPRKSSRVKRPRSEELSEDDLLNQYSLSFTKKTKKNNCENNESLNSSEVFVPALEDGTIHTKSLSTPPQTRNKFATFLQRKNKESGAVVVPGTRSRFFCNPLDSVDCTSEKGNSQPLDEASVTDKETNLSESDCLEPGGRELVDTNISHSSSDQVPKDVTVFADEESQSLTASKFTRTVSPPTLGTLRSCFSWSGSLGGFSRTPSPSPGTALQQLRRMSDSLVTVPENNAVSHTSQSNSDQSGGESPPLCEVESSQSQESIELSPQSLNASKLSQPSSKDSDSEESDCNIKSLDNQGNQNFKQRLSHFSKKDTLLRNKVPGLYKSSSVDSLSTTKIKPLVPARVSGLSKKPASVQKRNHHNAENKPGLQIKISELWKNFGFKKDSEKLPSCKKPLSPVRDNIQLTPETEEDIFNKPECARVQRAIFQ